jgi:hypothetical protein
MWAGCTDLGSAFRLLLGDKLKLAIDGKLIHSPNPADNLSKAKGLFSSGTWNTVWMASQSVTKIVFYL